MVRKHKSKIFINQNFSQLFSVDRVRCLQWLRKLNELPDSGDASMCIKNQYIQFLRIQVKNGHIHGIFKNSPPIQNNQIVPLAKCLGNYIFKKVNFISHIHLSNKDVIRYKNKKNLWEHNPYFESKFKFT